MSTYWGYVCESHDPPLFSEHWVNHGEDILLDAFRKERAGEWPDEPVIVGVNDALDPEPVQVTFYSDGYGSREPIHWLRSHPRCSVALHNEYGETRIIGDTFGLLHPFRPDLSAAEIEDTRELAIEQWRIQVRRVGAEPAGEPVATRNDPVEVNGVPFPTTYMDEDGIEREGVPISAWRVFGPVTVPADGPKW